MNYATERLFAAAQASLNAWEGEEDSVRAEHRDVIDELDQAICYFAAHGEKPVMLVEPITGAPTEPPQGAGDA